MSKKYKFERYSIKPEQLNFQEQKERREKGIPIQKRVAFGMKPNDFIETLFGVNNFYFIPENKEVLYLKNMVEQATRHCIYLLNQTTSELDSKLFDWTNHFLQGVLFILATKGWKENKLLKDEVNGFNERLASMPHFDLKINILHSKTPFSLKKLNMFVDKEKNEVTTSFGQDENEFNNFIKLVLYEEKGLTSIEKLECGINLLATCLKDLKSEKSYKHNDVRYEQGETDMQIHEEVICTLKQLGNCMAYLVNTTSWRGNQMFGFDEFEIRGKAFTRINDSFCRYYENIERGEVE